MSNQDQMIKLVFFTVGNIMVGIRVLDGQVAAVHNSLNAENLLGEFLNHASEIRLDENLPFDNGSTSDISPSNLFKSATASLMVAQVCNLRCNYCFAGDGDYGERSIMKWLNAKSVLDALFEKDDAELPVNINFFGGEPMLAWPLIEKCVVYAEGLGVEKGCAVSFSMTTNATRVTRDRVDFMRRHHFTVLVSIDGTQKDHDLARPDTRGNGSWEKVRTGSELLLSMLGKDNVHARATLRANHSSYQEMESTLKDIGFDEMYLCIEGVHPTRMLTDSIPETDWERKIEHANVVAENYTAKDISSGSLGGKYDPISEIVEMLLEQTSLSRPCGVGDSAISVSTDGTIYPCHRFVGEHSVALGNTTDSQSNLFGKKNFLALFRNVATECYGCFARRFCRGGCLSESADRLKYGLSAHDSSECHSIRGVTISAIRAVVRHLDKGLSTQPILVNRKSLNASCRAAFFHHTRSQKQTKQQNRATPRLDPRNIQKNKIYSSL